MPMVFTNVKQLRVNELRLIGVQRAGLIHLLYVITRSAQEVGQMQPAAQPSAPGQCKADLQHNHPTVGQRSFSTLPETNNIENSSK
jgi:hypothetical protein